MAENERPPEIAIINAIRTERQLSAPTDRSNLENTLVKSSLWKKNALRKIAESAKPTETPEAPVEREGAPSTDQPARDGEGDDIAHQAERRRAAILRRRSEEIARLRQKITTLEAENSRLTELHQNKLDSHRIELLEFQRAFDEFQQQSDQLLNELDQENERLRLECKLNNKRSLL